MKTDDRQNTVVPPWVCAVRQLGPTFPNMFNNRSQIDVVSVLLLLGEATIWKIYLGVAVGHVEPTSRTTSLRYRQDGVRLPAPSLLPCIHQAKSPNMIYDRAPENQIEDGLQLTNLHSGATHRWQATPSYKTFGRRGCKTFTMTKIMATSSTLLDLLALFQISTWTN